MPGRDKRQRAAFYPGPPAMPRPFNIIAACAENRVIGRDGRLPWRIAEDFAFFEKQTAGSTVIMGRISYETWTRAAQEGRHVIVISRDTTLAGPNVRVAPSLTAALALAEVSGLPGEIYVCGGESVYAEAMMLPQAARLYLTLVHAQPEGDKHFPDWRAAFPRILVQRDSADAKWRYTFLTLGR